jgi:hypothetical protein
MDDEKAQPADLAAAREARDLTVPFHRSRVGLHSKVYDEIDHRESAWRG